MKTPLNSRLSHKMLLKGSPGVLGDVPKFWGAFEASQPNLEVFLLDGRILEGGSPPGWSYPVFINDRACDLSSAGGGIGQWPSKAGMHHSHPLRAGYHTGHWVTTPDFLICRSRAGPKNLHFSRIPRGCSHCGSWDYTLRTSRLATHLVPG